MANSNLPRRIIKARSTSSPPSNSFYDNLFHKNRIVDEDLCFILFLSFFHSFFFPTRVLVMFVLFFPSLFVSFEGFLDPLLILHFSFLVIVQETQRLLSEPGIAFSYINWRELILNHFCCTY